MDSCVPLGVCISWPLMWWINRGVGVYALMYICIHMEDIYMFIVEVCVYKQILIGIHTVCVCV